MNYTRDLKRVEQVISQAKSAAWGNKLTPGEGQRKVRCCRDSFVSAMFSRNVPQVKVNLGGAPRFDEDGNIVPGRMVDMVVEGDEVSIVRAVV